MPFVLIFIGLLLIIVAVRDNQDAFYTQLGTDFTGQGNFALWVVAIVGIGSLGYAKPAKPIVDPFLALLLIVFAIAAFKNNGTTLGSFLAAFQNAFSSASNSVNGSQSSTNSTPLGQAETGLENSLKALQGSNNEAPQYQNFNPEQQAFGGQ